MADGEGSELLRTLDRIPPHLYAVIDGAHFETLPSDLDRLGLEYRPLYRRRGSMGGVPEGLFLVSLPDRASTTATVALVGDLAAVVFWSWPTGTDEIYSHLRHIAMIEIPSEPMDGAESGFDAVLLRHGDPNALVAVLKVLDVIQYGQILGDAAGLVLVAPEFGGLRTVPRPPECPRERRGGLIRLSAEQYQEMKGHHLQRSRQRIMDYLRDVGGDDAAQLDDRSLYAVLRAAETSGSSLGLKSEAAHGQWAFLMLKTGGEMANGPPVRRALMQSDNPDAALARMMQEMARLAIDDTLPVARIRGPG